MNDQRTITIFSDKSTIIEVHVEHSSALAHLKMPANDTPLSLKEIEVTKSLLTQAGKLVRKLERKKLRRAPVRLSNVNIKPKVGRNGHQ